MASVDSFPANANNNPNSKRRRFQAPITSFFTSSNSSEPTSSTRGNNNNNIESPTTSSQPVLSHKVQSSLLTVGMRIRKSVPEGYKTPTPSSMKVKSYPDDDTQTEEHTSGGTYAELTPYCGIMKTGNLSVQTFPRSNMNNIPSSSRWQQLFDQEGKVFSTGLEGVAEEVLPPSTKKRGWEVEEEDGGGSDDEETDMTMNFPPSSSQSSPVPSLIPSSSQSSSTSSMSALSSTPRQILQPRFGGQKKVRFAGLKPTDGEGQENRTCPLVMDYGDFEEASFLQRKEDLEMDVEVG